MPKYLETLNRKKLALVEKIFDDSEFLHQTILSIKDMRFCSMCESNHKKVFGKLKERRPWQSPY